MPNSEAPAALPRTLTVVYDERCAFCCDCRRWLECQPTHVPLRLLAAGSAGAQERWGNLPWLAEELAVVADDGRLWLGADAFLVCLWATRPYRALSLTLRTPALRPLARAFATQLSARAHRPCGPDRACPLPG